ncbi:MAG: nitrous oxide-stimulated promoter family protein [bacterium]|nr:nitrous oxide-stimulated promoter family protein [bacterium]
MAFFTSASKTLPSRRKGPADPAVVKLNQDVLTTFVEVYCWKNHRRERGDLCPQCDDLLRYACQRVERCPYDPKPKCKTCPTHCYKPDYRSRMKEVMRYSGMYFVKRGRIDWLIKYFFSPSI